MPTYLVTGATGFVGSHVADALCSRGTVRCLVRLGSDTTHLKSIDAELMVGDLTDAAAVAKAVDGVDAVIHCAAKVGDWGDVEEFRRVNVGGLRSLLDAVRGKPLQRFVQVSSLGVYAARHHYGTDEGEPLPESHIDGYTQSKVECEAKALAEYRKHGTPVTIVRPGFIYGPRDRTVLPRLATRLAKRDIIYISKGKHALNTTYVGNLVDAILLALDKPAAVGEVFNVTDGEFVSKRRFFEAIADGLGLPRPKGSIPLWLAKILARWREGKFRRQGRPTPPRITQAGVKFAGLNLDFATGKARTVLGWEPRVGFDEGMAAALAWYKQHKGEPSPGGAGGLPARSDRFLRHTALRPLTGTARLLALTLRVGYTRYCHPEGSAVFPLLVAVAFAQPPVEVPPPKDVPVAKDKAKPKAEVGPPEFEVQFVDGGNIRVVILEPMATVTTKFGKLEIPFTELKKVDLGFRYPAGVEAKVSEAVAKLGAPAFRDREEAEKELLSHKEYALSAVRKAAKSGDPEVVRRAEPLLKKLLSQVPEDRQTAKDYDLVETNDFTVKGRLELPGLKVKTKQFGDAMLRVDEVKAFRTLAVVAAGTEITVNAAQYGRQGWQMWMDTGVDIVAEHSVDISATGTIDQWPQEPGKYMSGPGGTGAIAPGFPPVMAQPGMPNGVVMRGMANRQFQSGMLIGKVGPAGLPFPVGAEFKQTKAGVGGRLFLLIAPSNWGNDSTGTYKVKVKVGE